MIINQIQFNAVTGAWVFCAHVHSIHEHYPGQASNLMSIPTDCDQRDERLGRQSIH